MLYVLLLILILLNAAWLVLVVFGLPGNWLIVFTTGLFAWWYWDAQVFSIWTLTVIVVLALLGELVEFFAGMAGAKRAGASWRGSIAAVFGALIGAVAGTFIIPIPFAGTLVGACGGAGLGVWAVENARGVRHEHALRRGLHAGLCAFLGIVSKLAAGIVIWLIVAIAAFWP